MPLVDFDAAARMRDVIAAIVRQEIANQRPKATYGTIVAIDRAARSCSVSFAGGGVVSVPMRTIQPSTVGSIVRVGGASGDRYVEEVVSGSAALQGVDMVFSREGVGANAGLYVSNNTTLDAHHSVVLTNNTSPITLTLPSPQDNRGRRYVIKRLSTGLVTIQTSGWKIDNANTFDLTVAYQSVVIVCDRNTWRIESLWPDSGIAEVLTSENTGSTGAFIDLATVGPSCTILTGTRATVLISAQTGQAGGADNIMGVAVSGASTIAATVDECAYYPPGMGGTLTGLLRINGLTPGLNTFTMKYYAGLGVGTYMRRRIAAMPSS